MNANAKLKESLFGDCYFLGCIHLPTAFPVIPDCLYDNDWMIKKNVSVSLITFRSKILP